jgi:hypothetical protein
MFCIIVFGRFLGSVCFLQVLRCFCITPAVNLKESLFMCFAGMIRGAIAFGLVLRLDDSLPNRSVIVTTSLSLVLVTTLLFGSFLGLLSIGLFGDQDKDEKKDYPKPNTNIQEPLIEEDEMESDPLSGSDSEFEEFQHPNMAPSQTQLMSKSQYLKRHQKMGKCQKMLKRWDEFHIRPFLIYKYEHDKMAMAAKYFDMFRKEGQNWEKGFVSQEINRSKTIRASMMVKNRPLRVIDAGNNASSAS